MKSKIFKSLAVVFLAALLTLTTACNVKNGTTDKSVTILYTNDIHAYLNNDANEEEPGLSYAEISQMKKDLGDNVLLVDAGDHIQGAVYGAMDQGETIIEIMNEMYDLATLGNHEFDYGVKRTLSITKNSKYPYISCNFVHKDNEKPVLKPHIMKNVDGVKIGFVGITTPETFTSTAPSYFQDENGEIIYNFLDGGKLYAAVQSSIDTLKADGADYIIALGHVGVDELSATTSQKIIENVDGLDAFIDGHSHTEMPKKLVKDKKGNDVLLTQTGYYLGGIGKMTLNNKGIKTEIIKEYKTRDDDVLAKKNKWVKDIDEMLGEKIGVLSNKLIINDENGKRLVRVKGTNLGEYIADSYYYYVNSVSQIDCDIAIINGGGIRAEIDAGDVTYHSLKAANPFGNMLCAVELTGQQILDALEWGARTTTGEAGINEEGAFLHTSGLTYTIDTSIPSTVQKNEQGVWSGSPTGEYRVKNVKVYDKTANAFVELNLEKTYCVTGANYTLTSKGDGFEMLEGKTIKDYIIEDYMALAVYTTAFNDSNNDNFSDITTENSPLLIYNGFDIDYTSPISKRINVK